MIPSELERLVQERIALGQRPYFVNCTEGTTVVGAFDPINPIADICEKYGMWFHVDAAWGGGCLLSRNQRHKLAGIERAQSVTWNPHKLMGTLLQCSTVHFREDVSVVRSFETGLRFHVPFFVSSSFRVSSLTATKCAQITCFNRTNTTTSHMIRETKSFNVDDTMTSSNVGFCGDLRFVKEKHFFLFSLVLLYHMAHVSLSSSSLSVCLSHSFLILFASQNTTAGNTFLPS